MNRGLLAYLILVAAPALGLGAVALTSAIDERERAEAEIRAQTDEQAELLAERLKAELGEAAAAAEQELARCAAEGVGGFGTGAAVAVIDPDGTFRYFCGRRHYEYALQNARPSASDLRLYRRARDGGDSYRYRRGDSERAIDAYTFYLPQIESAELRARLRLGAADAAAESGQLELAVAAWRQLVQEDTPARAENGTSLWLAALLRLEREERPLSRGWSADRWIFWRSLRLRTSVLDHMFATRTGQADRRELFFATRRNLEGAVRRALALGRSAIVHAGVVRTTSNGGSFLRPRLTVVRQLAWPGGGAHIVCSAEMGGPRLGRPGVRLVATREEASATPAGSYVVARALHAPSLPGPLGYLVVEDLEFAGKVAELDRRRLLQIAFVALLGITTLVGGLVTFLGFRRARRLARLREELLTNVTHELKTPVTSIRMFSEMLANDDLDEKRVREFGRLMNVEGTRLSQLIENVLDYARLGRGDVPLDREPIEMGALLEPLSKSFAFRAENENVAFRTELFGKVAAIALTHGPSVERIVANLLDNALKYREGSEPTILLCVERRRDTVAVSVADNGPGIGFAQQARVFEPFYRVAYHDYGVRGAGLGLAIARRLAARLGGSLSVSSRVGKGSTFTLELPASDSWMKQASRTLEP